MEIPILTLVLIVSSFLALALTCLAACAGPTADLLGGRRQHADRSRRRPDPAGAAVATREVRLRSCDEFEPEDWARVEAAVPALATDAGDRRVGTIDLYRFRRAGRQALIVAVRRDRAGGVLDLRTYDLDLERRCERRRRSAWPQPRPGSRPA